MSISLDDYMDSVSLLKLMILLSNNKYFDNLREYEKLTLDSKNDDVYIECTTSNVVDLMLFRLYFGSDKKSNIGIILDINSKLLLTSDWEIPFLTLDIDLDKSYTDVTHFILENTKLHQSILEIPHKKIYIGLLEELIELLVKKYDI